MRAVAAVAALLVIKRLCTIPIANSGERIKIDRPPMIFGVSFTLPTGDPSKVGLSCCCMIKDIHIRKLNSHPHQNIAARRDVGGSETNNSHVWNQYSAWVCFVRGNRSTGSFRPNYAEAALSSLGSANILNCWTPEKISGRGLPAIARADFNAWESFVRNPIFTKFDPSRLDAEIGSDLSLPNTPSFGNGFPTQRSRELFRRIREFGGVNREFIKPITDALPTSSRMRFLVGTPRRC